MSLSFAAGMNLWRTTSRKCDAATSIPTMNWIGVVSVYGKWVDNIDGHPSKTPASLLIRIDSRGRKVCASRYHTKPRRADRWTAAGVSARCAGTQPVSASAVGTTRQPASSVDEIGQLDYMEYAGVAAPRKAIAEHVQTSRGTQCDPDHT
jgi:hypothetical protein